MPLIKNIAALGLGITLSQFPEYSQQYVQRLGGAADELTKVVEDFDRTAQRSDQTRAQALASMTGTEFLDGRRADMEGTISRQERLSASYDRLKDADAFTRLANIHRFSDSQIGARAWEDYQPAIPITIESGALLLGGYVGLYGLLSFFGRMFRRRPKPMQPQPPVRPFR
ncbi:MAG: DUF2937 family protein [Pseudomonadota bacterium]